MNSHNVRMVGWGLAVAFAFALVGCAPRAQPAEPGVATQTLRQALDAWKNGDAVEAYRQRSAVTVVESTWSGGTRLMDYELLGDGESSGFDWQCKVRLTLQDAGGKQSKEKAVYSISTSPRLVIVRAEGS